MFTALSFTILWKLIVYNVAICIPFLTERGPVTERWNQEEEWKTIQNKTKQCPLLHFWSPLDKKQTSNVEQKRLKVIICILNKATSTTLNWECIKSAIKMTIGLIGEKKRQKPDDDRPDGKRRRDKRQALTWHKAEESERNSNSSLRGKRRHVQKRDVKARRLIFRKKHDHSYIAIGNGKWINAQNRQKPGNAWP